jgi:hypothetical protein
VWKYLAIALAVFVAACSSTSIEDTTTTTITGSTSSTTEATSSTSMPASTTTSVAEVNRPPTIEIVLPEDLSAHEARLDEDNDEYGANVAFSSVVSDANGDDITVTWSSSVQGMLGTGESIDAFISSDGSDASQPVITATATDGRGGSASDSIQILVLIPSDA